MFARLRCHGCGKRSPWSKGTLEFTCDSCDATNFYNSKGEVTHPPEHIANPYNRPAPAQKTFQTFTQPQSSEVPVRADDIFCARCLNNQRVYTEAVSNYLPDEDHPRYQEFEDTLDQFKADMEKKYPQVCKRCAPRVQQKIHRADYYGKSQQIAASMMITRNRSRRSPLGQRDDWGKWTMRMVLRLLGLVVYASLLSQIVWHMSGIAATYLAPRVLDEFDAPGLTSGVTFADCSAQLKTFQLDIACHHVFGNLIPIALLTSLCMLWYNHGLKDWYHDTYRMEAINGKTQHYRIQVFLLIARAIAWYKLSDPWVIADMNLHEQYAAHGFMIVFMIIAQRVSERPIKAERWKLQGKMMPRPDEVDVFSATAGPAEEQYQRHASSVHPLKLFERNEKPFPIENLAPKPRGYSRIDISANPPPSPPDSDSPIGNDAMDIDWQPTLRSQMPGAPIDRTFRQINHEAKKPKLRSTYNYGSTQPLGWGAVRNELFGIEDKTRAEEERKRKEQEEKAKLRYEPPVDPSPFRGRLPQAPMSMERRLRNPVTQVQFKKQPLSKQQDFMAQMREGVESGRYFGQPKPADGERDTRAERRSALDFDEDFSPVKNRVQSHLAANEATPAKARTKGSLDLHDSGWRLPGDYATSTGLEDLFAGKSFSIDDASDGHTVPDRRRPVPLPPTWLVLLGLLGVLGAVVWNVQPLRRAFCFWLLRQLGLEGVEVIEVDEVL